MPSESEEITPNEALQKLGVTKFTKQGSSLKIQIGEKRILLFDIDKTKVQKTLGNLKIAAKEAQLNDDILAQLKFILASEYVEFLTLSDKSSKQEEEEEQDTIKSEFKVEAKKIFYATVYADDTRLLEAVFIAGIPNFAEVLLPHPDSAFLEELEEEQKEGKVKIRLYTEIPLDKENVLQPLPAKQYITIPYKFRSIEEFNKIVERVRTYENLDPSFKKVEAIWTKYVDVGKKYNGYHQTLCAADTIFTYQQDKFGLTHYDFFIGDNTSGKSANLLVFHYLAYRNMFSVGLSYANVYQFLGGDKEGAGTISEDEADDIENDKDKMDLYKSGYQTGIPVFKIDTSVGRQQLKLNTFCFKGFAGEKLPDVVKAKGFLQRLVIFPCSYGIPQYDISEVINPAGDEEFKWLLDELYEVRNELLVYRLLHYRDLIPNITLNLQNREKQLFKPTLRLFQNSSKETLQKIQVAVGIYATNNRKRRLTTLHAFVFKTIRNLLKDQQEILEKKGEINSNFKVNKLPSSLVWSQIKADLSGEKIPNKPMSFQTEDFDIISQKSIAKILKEVFDAESCKDTDKNIQFKFDLDNLDRLALIYEQPIDVSIIQDKKIPTEQEEKEESRQLQKDAKGGEE